MRRDRVSRPGVAAGTEGHPVLSGASLQMGGDQSSAASPGLPHPGGLGEALLVGVGGSHAVEVCQRPEGSRARVQATRRWDGPGGQLLARALPFRYLGVWGCDGWGGSGTMISQLVEPEWGCSCGKWTELTGTVLFL